MKTVAPLQRCPLFRGLDEASLGEISRVTRPRRSGRGELIFSRGDPAERMYVVSSGEVKLFLLSPEGREQIVRLAGPGVEELRASEHCQDGPETSPQ